MADADACVVDEDIDAAHRADRFGERGFHLHQVGNIGNDGFRNSGQLLTEGFAGLSVAVEDADLRAFFQKARGGGSANAAGASSDEDSLVVQAAHGRGLPYCPSGPLTVPMKPVLLSRTARRSSLPPSGTSISIGTIMPLSKSCW